MNNTNTTHKPTVADFTPCLFTEAESEVFAGAAMREVMHGAPVDAAAIDRAAPQLEAVALALEAGAHFEAAAHLTGHSPQLAGTIEDRGLWYLANAFRLALGLPPEPAPAAPEAPTAPQAPGATEA